MSVLRELLGCQWGSALWTVDDAAVCPNQATGIVVIHDGEAEIDLKLCPAHQERVLRETTPHKED